MADSKLTGLTANTTPALTDLVYLVDDPGGTPLSQKITIANLLATPSPTLVTPVLGVAAGTSLNLSGQLFVPAGSVGSPSIKIGSSVNGFYESGGIGMSASGNLVGQILSTGIQLNDGMFFGIGFAADPKLYKDATGIFGQRNGTNAQADRTYNTWTNASNGEWLEIGYKDTTNVATIKSKANGTGTVRDLALDPGTADLQIVKALVALGGGAAPTLGTIGGSGPATAGQNTWLRLKDSTGAAFFMPVWK